VSLLSRVIRLESRAKVSAKPVHVVVQHEGESHKEVVGRTKAENDDPEAMLIVVNFVYANEHDY